MKKNILLLSMLFFLFSGCDFSIWEIKNKDEKKPIQKKNSISELKPKHRFAMPLEDVKNEKKAKETSKNIAKYNIGDIAEITEEVMKNYPFESKANGYKRNMEMIKQDFPKLTKEEFIANDSLITNYYDANLDYEVLQVLKKTKTPKKEKKEVKLKLNIKDLTRPPMEVREDQAFLKGGSNAVDELRRREAAEREKERKQRERARKRAKWCRENPVECHEEDVLRYARGCKRSKQAECDPDDNWCIFKKVLGHIRGWGMARKGLAIRHSYASVENTGLFNKFNKKPYGKVAGRKDVIRHLYFQLLLCNNYGGSMGARLDFAKDIGDYWEEIGDNNADDMEMDYHNNAVGRKLYQRIARYEWVQVSYWFWWVWERRLAHLSDHDLLGEAARLAKDKNIIQNVPNEVDIKILVEYGDTIKVNNEPVKFYLNYKNNKICYHRHWIRHFADKNKPVYIKDDQK